MWLWLVWVLALLGLFIYSLIHSIANVEDKTIWTLLVVSASVIVLSLFLWTFFRIQVLTDAIVNFDRNNCKFLSDFDKLMRRINELESLTLRGMEGGMVGRDVNKSSSQDWD